MILRIFFRMSCTDRYKSGARHSLRVSGAVFKVSDFEGVSKLSDFAPSKMRSV